MPAATAFWTQGGARYDANLGGAAAKEAKRIRDLNFKGKNMPMDQYLSRFNVSVWLFKVPAAPPSSQEVASKDSRFKLYKSVLQPSMALGKGESLGSIGCLNTTIEELDKEYGPGATAVGIHSEVHAGQWCKENRIKPIMLFTERRPCRAMCASMLINNFSEVPWYYYYDYVSQTEPVAKVLERMYS